MIKGSFLAVLKRYSNVVIRFKYSPVGLDNFLSLIQLSNHNLRRTNLKMLYVNTFSILLGLFLRSSRSTLHSNVKAIKKKNSPSPSFGK